MNPRTIATLDRLTGVDWFRNVGVADTNAAVVLGSWDAAIEHCGSIEWENLCLEAANAYIAKLTERAPERARQWNDVVRAVKPISQALVLEKTAHVIAAHGLPQIFLDTVDWDILHLCMEAEYADIYPAGFYASQAYWYLAGHFPCGWQGEFPEGKLVIY